MRISDWSSDVCSSDLRARLIEAGKIIERDGRLSNLRAEKELGNALETGRKHAENGANGGRKRAENERASRENNGIDQAGPNHRAGEDTRSQIPDKTPEPSNEGSPPQVAPVPVREDKARGSRLTLETIPDDWRAFDLEAGHTAPDRAFRKFREYWTARPGTDGPQAAWVTKWRQ